MPQVSGEGESVTLNNTIKAPFTLFSPEGHSEQETRSGKNKIEITKTTTTVNGCTHTIKNGTDTLSGTSLGDWANLIIYSFVGDGKTYTLSGSPSTSKNIFISAHDNVQNWDLATSKNGSTGTFVATSGIPIDIIICVAPNLTLANELFKPQLEEGSTATEWEQGGASPSPDYPSEVKSCGDNGSINEVICNKNIFKETYNRKDATWAFASIVIGECFLEKDKTYVVSFDTTNNGGTVYLGEEYFQSINAYVLKCDGTRKFFTAKARKFGYFTDITVLKTRADTTNAYNISNVMISEYENDTDTEYVQHEEQSYTIPTQQPMRSIGDVRDKFVKVNGNWFERHLPYIASYNGETLPQDVYNEEGGIKYCNSKSMSTTGQFSNGASVQYVNENNWNYLPCTPEQIQQLENLPSTYKDFTIIQSQDETEAYLEVSGIYDLNNLINN